MDHKSHTSWEFRHYFVSKSWLIAISILVLGLSIAGFISALPRPNAAHAVSASTPTLQVSPSAQSYFSNTKLRVQGSNYPSSAETVNVYWDYKNAGNPGTFVGTSVSSKGAFTDSFSIPASSTKYYTIAAVGQTSGTVATTTFHLLPNLYALPRAIGPGSKFTLTGQAFGANETVNIYSNCSSNCTGPTLAQGVTDGNGYFQITATIPSTTTIFGKNFLFGIGQTSNMSDTANIIVYPPTLALAPLSGSAGTQLSMSAYGFRRNEKVSVSWSNNLPFSVQTNSNGYVPVTVFTVPSNTPPDNYTVTMAGATGKPKITNTFTVVAPSSNLTIPGSNPSSSSGPVGSRVRVSGQGYVPGETINIVWNHSTKYVATTTADGSGGFHVSFLVPTNTNNGNYVVEAVGATSKSVTQNTFTVASGLSASPLTFAAGQSTNLAGSGFLTNETVNFYWDSTSGKVLSTVTANGNGNVAQAVTIPAKATPGSHAIIAVGQISHITYNTAVTVDTAWNDFGFSAAHLRQNTSENVVNTGNVANLQLRWNKSIGSPQPEGAPSPIYYYGLVYIATFDGYLNAYDATTGTLRWQFPTGTNFANLSSPVIDPATGILFFGTLGFLEDQDHGVPSPFFALDAKTGKLLWSEILNGDDYAFPTMAFNNIYVGLANEGGGALLSIDETTGYINAQYQADGGVWGAVGVDVKTNRIFTGVGNPGDEVLAFDANTFKGTNTSIQPLLRFYRQTPGNDDDIGAAMAVANGVIYVDTKSGLVYALNENNGTEIWPSPAKIRPNSIGNVSSPAVDSVNGVLYVGSLNDYLYALSTKDGSLLWKAQTHGKIYSSPALANGVVYVASNDHNIYAFDATTGAQLKSLQTKAPTFSSPIIVNGWLYCASTDGQLYAFSL